MARKIPTPERRRYGIGEWYGRLFSALSVAERRKFGSIGGKKGHHLPCIPRLATDPQAVCSKAGGVCSLGLYTLTSDGTTFDPNSLVTLCPYRFWEGNKVFRFVSQRTLKQENPILIVKEVGFLQGAQENGESECPVTGEGETIAEAPLAGGGGSDVGRIDMVLVRPGSDPPDWCALEMQSVYFSGRSMLNDFRQLAENPTSIFPSAHRRPDFRSSGPKRLMPQLQIKVPTLRRWGKKMAVIVDKPFFDSLFRMDEVAHLSNADIAWFVLAYRKSGKMAELDLHGVHYTTLERAVEGLTAGQPVSLEHFESDISKFLTRRKYGKKIISVQ